MTKLSRKVGLEGGRRMTQFLSTAERTRWDQEKFCSIGERDRLSHRVRIRFSPNSLLLVNSISGRI
jgi:hypothetical protein